jgi:sugar/nucleoside kinase (ribokinase family)
MLAALGDLLEDIIVSQREPVNHASDTTADITRRQGGSASNVALTAARRGAAARFIGQVGEDASGRALVAVLSHAGVDTSPVRFDGNTGTIVVLVDELGERTMYTDRRSCVSLADPEPRWLDGVETLHVPFYSLAAAPLAETAATMIRWAHDRDIAVSIDASSRSVLLAHGPAAAHRLLERLAPDIVFANDDEARVLGLDHAVAAAVTVVKRGGNAAVVHLPDGSSHDVDAQRLGGIHDTTGAGDAFAAGFLTWPGNPGRNASRPAWKHEPTAACVAGHAAAAALLASR